MIARLRGLVSAQDEAVVVDVQGVGYEVQVCPSTLAKIRIGQLAVFEVATLFKQDSLSLYGFLTIEEKRLFSLLLSVSGVGPRTSLHIVDRGVPDVIAAVQRADVSFFTSIPRLGKKNAQKIIIELSTKVDNGLELPLADSAILNSEAAQALQALGYDDRSIQKSLHSLELEGKSTQEIVKLALRMLS